MHMLDFVMHITVPFSPVVNCCMMFSIVVSIIVQTSVPKYLELLLSLSIPYALCLKGRKKQDKNIS